MSGKQIAPYVEAIDNAREKFIAAAGDLVRYEDEAVFAMQALSKNDWSIKVANENPKSVQLAMRNVAATGLSLNPAYGYAFLVPRDGAIVLDIGYKGIIKIGTDCGSIMWARADVVYAKDAFAYNGPAAAPLHQADVFNPDRGELIGSYCIAKTREGDILCEVMPLSEIEKIRSKSDLFKKKQSGPWVEFFVQMVKKSCIKRAAKTWPYTGRSGKLFEAIELASESEGGYTFEQETVNPKAGAWDAVPVEDHEMVRKTAATLREYFETEDLKGAVEYLERQALPAEHQIALWTLLPAPMRSAYKVAKDTLATLGAAA